MHAADPMTATTPAPIVSKRFFGFWSSAYRFADRLAPISDLLLRLWVGKAFWDSGLTKIQSWDTTIQLFTFEYHVPVLSPEIAAAMAAGGELALPVLLIGGLLGRFAAVGLFVLNAVAVISYPDLGDEGRAMHLIWGLVLLSLALRGPGKLSIDHFLGRRLGLR